MQINKIFFATAALALTVIYSSCTKKDDAQPVEQELITTMKLLVTDTAGNTQTYVYKVENGFGTTTLGTVQIDTVKLKPNQSYHVVAELYNEKASPVENTTLEILDENKKHLFLYQSTPATGAGSIAFTGGSTDDDGQPFNQTITFATAATGNGSLQVNLMHEPTNKNGTTPATSGGETDAECTYPVIIQ